METSDDLQADLYTLPNGLRVVHRRRTSTPMATLAVMYDAGARDEEPSLTGLAHLTEHLMFGGEIRDGATFDRLLEQCGGSSNAWTSSDFTLYHDTLPACYIERAFMLESLRMPSPMHVTERELNIQRRVVMEEYKQTTLNVPYGDVDRLVRSMMYTTHPYRYPVIGDDITHLERVTLDDVNAFHRRLYTPSRAVVAVTGNVTAAECLELAHKWFGPIPPGDTAPRTLQHEPAIIAPRLVEVHRDVPTPLLIMGWHMPPHGHPGYLAADALTDILANGRSSRLQRLVKENPFVLDLEASIYGLEETGIIMIQAALADDSDDTCRRASDLIYNTLYSVVNEGPGSYELERAANKYAAAKHNEALHYTGEAMQLATAVMHGTTPQSQVEAYRALTPGDIARAAATLTPGTCATLRYRTQG